ncbi:MAG: hypothetical protein OHK0012_16390 [Synechococcales cyanobacterium]
MGLFEDLSQFLESRLDEFLKAHPELELQVLEDQLRQQEVEAQRLFSSSQLEDQRQQQEILRLAEEIKTWHFRVEKARHAGRLDLAKQAEAYEDRLLQQGNQAWAAMRAAQQRQMEAQQLLGQIKSKQEEVKQRQRDLSRQQGATTGSPPSATVSPLDPQKVRDLEKQFQELEVQLELEQLRRQSR